MNRIVIIGSSNMDITVLADRRPIAGETILGNGLHMSPGGKGANQAVAAAKLGADVTMVGAVGSDVYGTMILENLQKYGINTDYMVRRDDMTSGTAHITLAEKDNSIIVISGANKSIDATLVDDAWERIEQADLVMIQNEIPLDTIEYVLNRCAEKGIKVLLNPAPAIALPLEWLEKASYITPNEHEFDALYGQAEIPAEIAFLQNQGKLILTMGKDGVGYCEDGLFKKVSAFVVDPVDTTGAGDTFNGALATALVNGKSLSEAIRFGNAAAALSIQKLGAQEGMPTAQGVESFLQARNVQ